MGEGEQGNLLLGRGGARAGWDSAMQACTRPEGQEDKRGWPAPECSMGQMGLVGGFGGYDEKFGHGFMSWLE